MSTTEEAIASALKDWSAVANSQAVAAIGEFSKGIQARLTPVITSFAEGIGTSVIDTGAITRLLQPTVDFRKLMRPTFDLSALMLPVVEWQDLVGAHALNALRVVAAPRFLNILDVATEPAVEPDEEFLTVLDELAPTGAPNASVQEEEARRFGVIAQIGYVLEPMIRMLMALDGGTRALQFWVTFWTWAGRYLAGA